MSYTVPYGLVAIEKALTYNEKSVIRLRIPDTIPTEAKRVIPGLENSPASNNRQDRLTFYEATKKLQALLGYSSGDIDGCYGPNTHEDTAKYFRPTTRAARHIVYNGRRVELFGAYSMDLYGLDSEQSYDISRSGHFTRYEKSRNPNKVRVENFVVQHWGGKDVDHLRRYFYGNDKSVSSHFAGDTAKVVQYLDIGVASHHAGSVKKGKQVLSMNQNSVGLDCAQFPESHRFSEYRDGKDRMIDVSVVKNPERKAAGNRGLVEMLTLDARTALGIQELTSDILRVINRPYIVPRDSQNNTRHTVLTFDELMAIHRGEEGAPTVIGHHHISKTKPDIIGWWATIHG